MAGSNMDDDYTSMDEGEDIPTVLLKDEYGRSLKCYVERSMEIGNQEYLLLLPVDAPIEIFAWDSDEDADEDDEDDEMLVDIDEEEINEVFDTAKAVLGEQNLFLARTAFTLTASGELPEATDDDVITLDISDSEENGDTEEFQLLANFFYEEQEYAICTPFEPLLFFARVSASGDPELLPPEEFEAVRSQLEDQLFDELE